jgi:hypothetical protein
MKKFLLTVAMVAMGMSASVEGMSLSDVDKILEDLNKETNTVTLFKNISLEYKENVREISGSVDIQRRGLGSVGYNYKTIPAAHNSSMLSAVKEIKKIVSECDPILNKSKFFKKNGALSTLKLSAKINKFYSWFLVSDATDFAISQGIDKDNIEKLDARNKTLYSIVHNVTGGNKLIEVLRKPFDASLTRRDKFDIPTGISSSLRLEFFKKKLISGDEYTIVSNPFGQEQFELQLTRK